MTLSELKETYERANNIAATLSKINKIYDALFEAKGKRPVLVTIEGMSLLMEYSKIKPVVDEIFFELEKKLKDLGVEMDSPYTYRPEEDDD